LTPLVGVSPFFFPCLSCPFSIVVSYGNKREKNESIPNINWFQLLGLKNFTEVLDLISNSMPISKQQAKNVQISPYRP
jgi:hypothetical protein